MAFRVYQDGKPADCFNHEGVDKSWNNSRFETYREAKIHAIHWAYPVGRNQAEDMSETFPEFELGVPKDCSIAEVTTMMEIREEL